MDTLSKLFGSRERVRMMRLFLFNPDAIYNLDNIVRRVGAGRKKVGQELAVFKKAGLIKRKKKFVNKRRKQKMEIGWVLDQSFPYLKPIQSLLIQQVLLRDSDIITRLSSVGKLKLVVVAGVFMQDSDGRVDLFVVGDNLKKWLLDRAVKGLEAEIGKELRYAAFETPDFQYRLGMYDKLIRDVFDYPHRRILDRIGIVR